MSKEVLNEAGYQVNRIVYSDRVSIRVIAGDFSATLDELEFLHLMVQDIPRPEIIKRLGLTEAKVKHIVDDLTRNNYSSQKEKRVWRLAKKAWDLQLLFPITLAGLRSLKSEFNPPQQPRFRAMTELSQLNGLAESYVDLGTNKSPSMLCKYAPIIQMFTDQEIKFMQDLALREQ